MAKIQKEKGIIIRHPAYTYKAKQPNTANAYVSDSDPSLVFQAHISYGVNNSQIVLHAGQSLKVILSVPRQSKKSVPYF